MDPSGYNGITESDYCILSNKALKCLNKKMNNPDQIFKGCQTC